MHRQYNQQIAAAAPLGSNRCGCCCWLTPCRAAARCVVLSVIIAIVVQEPKRSLIHIAVTVLLNLLASRKGSSPGERLLLFALGSLLLLGDDCRSLRISTLRHTEGERLPSLLSRQGSYH